MASQDLHSKVFMKYALNPTVISADGTILGEVLDTVDFESVELVAMMGIANGGLFNVNLQESDDDSIYTVVATNDLIGETIQMNSANSIEIRRVGYKGKKRYLRVELVSSGSPTATTVVANYVLSNPRSAATEENTAANS